MSTIAHRQPSGFLTATRQLTYRNMAGYAGNPSVLIMSVVQSVVFLLIFTLIFRHAVDVERSDYVTFVVPGLLTVAVLFSSMHIATKVALDRSSGFMDRVRSLPLSRPAIPSSYAIAGFGIVILTLIATVLAAFAVGFHPVGSVPRLALCMALLAGFAFSIVWIFVALGLWAPSAAAAQGMSFLVMPISFLSDAFVPVDAMVEWLRPIATYQPISAVTSAVRHLIMDPVPDISIIAPPIAWILVILLVGTGSSFAAFGHFRRAKA